ncbi:hypothetical protein AA313_de0204480 [Arthrobotrys entomopaga]|nr:hypothetical protein AA313_de0204480 [Arthrobotrys entomopaga]
MATMRNKGRTVNAAIRQGLFSENGLGSENSSETDAVGEASGSTQRTPWLDLLVRGAALDPNLKYFHRPPALDISDSFPDDDSVVGGKEEPSLGSLKLNGEKEAYILSPIGDVLVKLHHNNTEIRYLVIGQILRIISPIWEKCLDPNSPFKCETSRYDGQDMVALHLEDDDPNCLLILFRCTHFQYDDIPTKLDFDQLLMLATICDKYDCAKALAPWLNGWLAPWEESALKPGYEDWLFISKVFEYTGKVQELISLLAENTSSLSACGSYLKRDGCNFYVDAILDPMLERIVKEREKTVVALTEGAWNTIELLLNSDGEISKWCSDEVCVSLVYGSLVRSIKASGLWVLFRDHQMWHGSVKDLRERLRRLTYTTINDSVVISQFSGVCSLHHRGGPGGYVTVTAKDCKHSCDLIKKKAEFLSKLKGEPEIMEPKPQARLLFWN